MKKSKCLKFPTAIVALLTQASCDPGGHLQKQNSSIPKGQGCIGGGQSQVQFSSFSILGLSQVKVHTSATAIISVVGVVALGVVVPLGRICIVVQCVEKKLFSQLSNTVIYFAIRLSGQFYNIR